MRDTSLRGLPAERVGMEPTLVFTLRTYRLFQSNIAIVYETDRFVL